MHVALLEDEPVLAEEVQSLLSGAGHSVVQFVDGAGILRGVLKDTFDLFVLDWHVPGHNGIEVLKHLRNNMQLSTPVIFLTANSAEEHVAQALEAGADDYCTKPLRSIEFMARLKALERRLQAQAPAVPEGELFEDYVFRRADRVVVMAGNPVSLTEKEFELTVFLFQNMERPVSRERIMQTVWGREEDALSRTLDVHISWIRRKLNLGAQGTSLRLSVVHGYGYRLIKVGNEGQD